MQEMTTLRRLTILLGIGLLTPSLAAGSDTRAGVLAGEDVTTAAPAPGGDALARTFGTLAAVAHTINAHAFVPSDSSVTYASRPGAGGDRYLTSAGFFRTAVNLPAGAVVVGLEIQGCDTSAAGELTAQLRSADILIPGTEFQEETSWGSPVSTGVAQTPGCGYFFAPFLQPPVVQNGRQTYYVDVTQGTTDGSNRFSAVRLYYRLQVSPSPATATFLDVPGGPLGHPFFRFIEALAAAGITGGCNPTGPLYCPDDFVTRGQMAVFISRALGLHFAP